MSLIKTITILLLITLVIQQAIVMDIDNKSSTKNGQVDVVSAFSFEHQCTIPHEEARAMSALLNSLTRLSPIFSPILTLLIWFYLFYSIVCTVLIAQYYKKNWLCLSYTITSLYKQVHNGLLYLIYSEVTQGYQTYGKIYFYIIAIPSLFQIARIAFFEQLEWTQKRAVSAYLFLIILGLTCYKEYYSFVNEAICYTIYAFQLSYSTKNKNFNKYNSILININLFISSILFYFVPVYSDNYFLEPTRQQRMFYFLYSVFMLKIFVLKDPSETRIQLWRSIRRLFYVVILKRLGYKLQVDTCSICWQEMDIYLGVEDIKDIHNVSRKALIRVHRNHIFHRACIIKWSLSKVTCPLDNELIEI